MTSIINRSGLIYDAERLLSFANFLADWQHFVAGIGPRAAEILLAKAKAPWPPKTLSFDLTSECNLHCPMCRYHGDAEAEAAFSHRNATVDQVVRFVREAGGADVIAFGVMSEPFLRKDIWECLERLQPLCAAFAFSTNALPLTPASIERLSRFPIDSIRISCDAGDAEGYARWRTGGRFDQFLPKLACLAETFGKRAIFHAAVFKENLVSLLNAPEILRSVGVATLELARLVETPASRRNGLTPLNEENLEQALLAMLERCDRAGVQLNFGVHGMGPRVAERLFAKTGGRLGCADFKAGWVEARCSMPWQYLGLELGGSVKPCCGAGSDGFHGGKNAFLRSAQTLFNDESITVLRAMTMAGFTPRICQTMCNKNYDMRYKEYDPALW